VVIPAARAMYRHCASAMMPKTRLQSTPRTDAYKSAPARRHGITHDQTLRRISSGALASRGLLPITLLHEVVADHVEHDHVEVFDAAGMRMGNPDFQRSQRAERAA
jgi:hypothetical protein